jgi:hypothetical protein
MGDFLLKQPFDKEGIVRIGIGNGRGAGNVLRQHGTAAGHKQSNQKNKADVISQYEHHSPVTS